MRGEADGRVKAEEENGHVRVGGAVNSHQLEFVVVVAVEDGPDCVTHFLQGCQGHRQAKFHVLQFFTTKLRLDMFSERHVADHFPPRPQVVDVPF